MDTAIELAQATACAFLTKQEKAFCKGVAQGQMPVVVAKSVGIKPVSRWVELMERPDIVQTLAVLKHQLDQFLNIEVTKDLLNTMLFEAHATAATSMEKIAAVRELGKMNGVYAPEKKEITLGTATKIGHLEALSDNELCNRASFAVTLDNTRDDEIVVDPSPTKE